MVFNATDFSNLLATNKAIQNIQLMFAVALCVLAPLIIFGSGLIIASTITFRKLRTPHHILLCCLACDDLILATWTIPMLAMLYFNQTRHLLSEKVPCVLLSMLIFTNFMANFSIINILNIDRFISIQFPLRYYDIVTKFKLSIVISITWGFCLALSMTITWNNKYDETIGHLHISKRSCDANTVLKSYYVYWFLFSMMMCIGFSFCLNFIVWQTVKSHWKVIDKQSYLWTENVNAKVAKRARNSRVASILLALYAMLWMPYIIITILYR